MSLLYINANLETFSIVHQYYSPKPELSAFTCKEKNNKSNISRAKKKKKKTRAKKKKRKKEKMQFYHYQMIVHGWVSITWKDMKSLQRTESSQSLHKYARNIADDIRINDTTQIARNPIIFLESLSMILLIAWVGFRASSEPPRKRLCWSGSCSWSLKVVAQCIMNTF